MARLRHRRLGRRANSSLLLLGKGGAYFPCHPSTAGRRSLGVVPEA
jgi:hypothetical protein